MLETYVDREEFKKEEAALNEIHELLGAFEENELEGIKMFLMGMAFMASSKKVI